MKKFEPYERIEFAFILLPAKEQLLKIKNIAKIVHQNIQSLPIKSTIPNIWGNYSNRVLKCPHLSVGQYGVLGAELDIVETIVSNIAAVTPPLNLQMNNDFSYLDDYIFFDAANCFEKVDSQLKDIYYELRTAYFSAIKTRFPISQAHLAKLNIDDKKEELDLIETYFQNWMIPEFDRMRPHFTLHYHPPFQTHSMQKTLENNSQIKDILKDLTVIHLTQLGLIEIDVFGNPKTTKPLFSYLLNVIS